MAAENGGSLGDLPSSQMMTFTADAARRYRHTVCVHKAVGEYRDDLLCTLVVK